MLFSYISTKTPHFLAWQQKRECPWIAKEIVKNRTKAELLKNSFLCGGKKGLKRFHKQAYKNLNLYHLFTPSGIHLGIFYMLNLPLINLVGRKSNILKFIFNTFLFIWPWLIDGFYSLKRISGMQLIKLLPFKIDSKKIFFIFFTLDYFFGTYKYSEISWTFSFLFLGIVFHTHHKSFIQFSLYLFSGQLLASVFSMDLIYPLSFFPSFLLTALFTPVFMLVFFDNLFNLIGIELLSSTSNKVVLGFDSIVIWFNQIILATPKIRPEFLSFILTIGILIKSKKIIIVSLIFHSFSIYNLPIGRAKQSSFIHQTDIFFSLKPEKTRFDRRGIIKLFFKNGRRCSINLYNYGFTKKCRFSK